MKILHIVDDFPSISTPFILNQITGLIDRGVIVDVLTKKVNHLEVEHEIIKEYELEKELMFFDKVEDSFKGRLSYFMKNSFKMLFKHPSLFFKSLNILKYKKDAFSLRLFHEVSSLLKYDILEYDIIHAQFGTLGVVIERLKEIGVIKGVLVTHFRGYDLEKTIRFEGPNYYDRLFKNGNLFLANCNYFRNYLLNKGLVESSVLVQYSGINVSFFKDYKTSYTLGNKLRLGSVGAFRRKKGYKYILHALTLLKKANVDFSYEIVGDGPERRNIELLIQELNLENHVVIYGFQNHTYIKSFLKTVDVFISHNITSESGDMDAPVNTIKEATLIGVPVISTFHGGIPEIITDGFNGFLTEEKDVDGIQNKILEVVDLYNSNRIEDVVLKARDLTIKKFDNDILNDQLLKVYTKAIN